MFECTQKAYFVCLQSPLSILYPPCDVRSFSALPLDTPRTNNFLSVAQFRPEKEHHVQIKALSLLLQRSASTTPPLHAKLVLAGSVRNEGDARRVEGLRQLAKELKVEVSYLTKNTIAWSHVMLTCHPF